MPLVFLISHLITNHTSTGMSRKEEAWAFSHFRSKCSDSGCFQPSLGQSSPHTPRAQPALPWWSPWSCPGHHSWKTALGWVQVLKNISFCPQRQISGIRFLLAQMWIAGLRNNSSCSCFPRRLLGSSRWCLLCQWRVLWNIKTNLWVRICLSDSAQSLISPFFRRHLGSISYTTHDCSPPIYLSNITSTEKLVYLML